MTKTTKEEASVAVLNYLQDREYLFYVKQIDPNSILINIPETYATPKTSITYEIKGTSLKALERYSSITNSKKVYTIPHYSMRVFVLADIKRIAQLLKYDSRYIVYLDAENSTIGVGAEALLERGVLSAAKSAKVVDLELDLYALYLEREKKCAADEALMAYAELKKVGEGFKHVIHTMDS